MKSHKLELLLLALLLIACASAFAAQRLVLNEAWDQWNCPPCANWDVNERIVLDAFGPDTVISIKYHVWWPAQDNDAFYWWNTTENTARVNFYGVNYIPDSYIDGTLHLQQNQTAFRNQIRTALAVPAPCTFDLHAVPSAANTVAFTGTIHAEQDMTNPNLRLFAVLVTDSVHYATAPGSNGMTAFYDAFRDMWPGMSGSPVSVAANGTFQFSGTLSKDPTWLADQLSVIVFVQNVATHAILQSAKTPVVCPSSDLPSTFCTSDGGTIPDGSAAGRDFVIHVPMQYHITDLNVSLDITHPYDMDLVISLRSPAGHTAVLAAQQGGGSSNYFCTTFDDEAFDSVGGGIGPFYGSYTPDQPLSGFDGENAMGDWVLHITDAFPGHAGAFHSACLTFTYDQILPVELASVSANPEQGGIRFSFATATENRNDHFELWRSASATGEFSRIASIRSQGNSSTAQQYSYLDADVVAGTTYSYYLTDVSINGDRREHRNLLRSATALSTPVPVEYALSVYPNPFNPTTTVSFSLVDAAKVKLTVYDVTGRVVSTLADKNYTAGTHTVLFDAASLPAGIYFTRIESASFTQTRKMALIK